ncbi:hypothetical protein LCGC14_2619540 [marine sediment metagenome]|uniref:Uncharacterized protein n=1 Tax=marine sediment metagenome TaxID=412755 RepID=A0A0F9A3E8_9ZZZZ
MAKYKIVKVVKKGQYHYVVKKKGLILWHYLCNDDGINAIATFKSRTLAKDAIKKDGEPSYEKVVLCSG